MKRIILSILLLIQTQLVEAKTLRVIVIDTGIDFTHELLKGTQCPDEQYSFTQDGNRKDTDGHGTHVAGLIVTNAKESDFCLVSIKFYDKKSSRLYNYMALSAALELAMTLNPDIINISGGGSERSDSEYRMIKYNQNVTIVTSAGNESLDLDIKGNNFFPASYNLPNIISVGALKKDKKDRLSSSNYGNIVKAWEVGEKVVSSYPGDKYIEMSGTSMACAIKTGKIVYERTH